MKICIFGAASYEIDKTYSADTRKLCKSLAEKGHSLVFGAGGNGLMGAAAEGFKTGGGEIVGVIPHFFRDENIEKIYSECTEIIFTDTIVQRKSKMEELADAFIIVPGGIGTLEELFEVLTLKQLARHAKPIAIYNINGYYDELIKFLNFACEEKFIRKSCQRLYLVSNNVDEITTYVENNERNLHNVHDMKKG